MRRSQTATPHRTFMLDSPSKPGLGTSLRKVLLRWVVALVVLQLVMTLLLGRFQLFSQMEALQVDLNADLAGTVGASVGRALQRPVTAVRAAVRHGSLLQQPSAVVQVFLQQMVDTSDAADIVYLLDAGGRVVRVASASYAGQPSGASRLGLDMSNSPVFGVVTPGEAVVSPAFLSPITDQPSIAVSGRHDSGNVLVMEINLSRLTERYNRLTRDNGTQVMIVDASGQILADHDGIKARQSAMLPASAMRALENTDSGAIELDGQTWLASGFPVGQNSLNWRVLVMRPLSQVYRPIFAIVTVSLLGAILVLVATLTVLLAGVRKVVRDTEILGKTARSLQAGAHPPATALSVRELSEVDAGLREMAATLLHREQMLLQANDVLEARVAERTRHLEETNLTLETTLKTLESTQAELVQSAKMSALGGMVAGVAHELNTPVGNARLTATTLLHAAQGMQTLLAGGQVSRSELLRSAQTVQDGAQLIDRSLERAGEIVRAFKQVAVDQASHRRRTFMLGDVLHENEVLLSPRLKKAGITVAIASPERLEMLSFPGDLGQVITNLIENAMVHGYQDAPAGRVDVTARREGADRVNIRVQDYGSGIAADALGRIFDPFYTTRMGHGGSGLGLAIVYNFIVSSLGGRIFVTSQPGQGTCFTLDLPMVAPLGENEGEPGSVSL